MAPELKSEHSFANCKGCYHRYPHIQALLPVKSNQFVGMAKKNPFFIAGKEAKIKPCKAGEAKEIARALYDKIDATFQKACSTSFGDVLTKIPELQLQKRKSPTEAKRERRASYRSFKQKVEDEWEKTSLLRCLGGRQSYAARQRERLDSSFEGKHAAIKRKESSEPDETAVVKRKRHAGNFEAMKWDKNGLKNEVEGYGDETKVNWSELARRYQIKNKKGQIAKNGGQIAQEWLISQGINLHRFKRCSENERQPRRKKLKGLGGEISLPTPETNDSLKQKLKLKIQQGEFTVGELIVPREVSM